MSDWNTQIIEEFRANGGKVGGNFTGAPFILVHHRGRKTGKESVAPLVYQPAPNDPKTLYVFASAAGAPKHPDWYFNVTTAGQTTVEVGEETFPVTVAEITGADRDRIYAQQVSVMPGFAEYEEKTAGIRTIPVVALHRQ